MNRMRFSLMICPRDENSLNGRMTGRRVQMLKIFWIAQWVLVSLYAVVGSALASGASVADQINNPSGSFGATNFMIGQQAGQSFVPTLPQLVAIEVDIVPSNPGNPGAGGTVTMTLLDGDRISSSQSQF